MSKDKLREILEEHHYPDVGEFNYAEAVQAILKNYRHIDDIRGAVPEKKELEKCCESPYHQGEKDGYNQAINDICQALDIGDSDE